MEGDKDGLNTAYVDLETQLEQLNRFGMAVSDVFVCVCVWCCGLIVLAVV